MALVVRGRSFPRADSFLDQERGQGTASMGEPRSARGERTASACRDFRPRVDRQDYQGHFTDRPGNVWLLGAVHMAACISEETGRTRRSGSRNRKINGLGNPDAGRSLLWLPLIRICCRSNRPPSCFHNLSYRRRHSRTDIWTDSAQPDVVNGAWPTPRIFRTRLL